MSQMLLMRETAETVKHQYLHCKVTGQVWRIFLALRGITWIMPGNIAATLVSWEEAGREIMSRRKMDNYTSMHMVDSLERKEFKVL